MRMPTEFVYEAVSFDWEALLPILFFLLYGIAQFFGSRKKADPPDDEPVSEEVDPLERARQIREEIKRKLEERRKGSAEQETTSAPSRERPSAPAQAPAGHSREGSSPAPQPSPAPRSSPSPGPPSQETSIEERLRRQQARLEESRQRQTEARKKAREMEKKAGVPARRRKAAKPVDAYGLVVPPAVLRRNLMKDLRDPNSLRKAVLLREILDSPLGLRSPSSPSGRSF